MEMHKEKQDSGRDETERRRQELIEEGRRWFELLGEQELLGTPITTNDGRTLKAEEFTLIYDEPLYMERVHPLFLALEADPDNEKLKSALREMLHVHLKPPAKTS